MEVIPISNRDGEKEGRPPAARHSRYNPLYLRTCTRAHACIPR